MSLPALEKLASTALVRAALRALRAGKPLSPETIRRAASAMPVGKFRSLLGTSEARRLGFPSGYRGQFSLGEPVIGHLPDRLGGTYAGMLMRKLPTHAVSPHKEYSRQARLIDRLNRRHPILNRLQAPPLARYVHVGPKGAFQELADRRVWYHPRRLTNLINDLHPGNIGPKGQIFDFGVRSDVAHKLPEAITPIRDQFAKHPRIDRASLKGTSPGFDLWGNWNWDEIPQQFRAQRRLSDSLVRRYHALPADQQGVFLQDLSRNVNRRWQEMAPVRKHRIEQDRLSRLLAETDDLTPRTYPLLRPLNALMSAPLPYRLAAAGGISTPLWGPRAWEILREMLTRQPAFGGNQPK